MNRKKEAEATPSRECWNRQCIKYNRHNNNNNSNGNTQHKQPERLTRKKTATITTTTSSRKYTTELRVSAQQFVCENNWAMLKYINEGARIRLFGRLCECVGSAFVCIGMLRRMRIMWTLFKKSKMRRSNENYRRISKAKSMIWLKCQHIILMQPQSNSIWKTGRNVIAESPYFFRCSVWNVAVTV